MSKGLTHFARLLLADPAQFRRVHESPFLVWEAPPESAAERILLGTFSGVSAPRPTATEPLVFELKKGTSRQNAFGLGITVGRTENNDLAVDDNSVSRFHAYFQQDARGRWTLADAESKNGTFVDNVRLEPRQPKEVKNKSRMRFGQVPMVFYSPVEFMDYMRAKMDAK